jgi:uncharacterized membrane protein
MITILPNWHPIFVHFTIGLLGTSVVFYFASAIVADDHRWKQQWQQMANWSLWTGCLVSLSTVFAGWHAYNTVSHDAASHIAMTLHRNWALATASLFLILGFAAISIVKNNRTPRFLFLSVAAIAGAMLMVTGFLGGEAVYRHGLGVMSLPIAEASGHDHEHNLTQDADHPKDNEQSSAHQHDETVAESEPQHQHDPEIKSNIDTDSNTQMDHHSHDAKEDVPTPHEH